MVVRFVKSLYKGDTFTISSETDLAQYITPTTEYTTSNESVATVANGVITGNEPGTAIITAIREDGNGVEINVKVIGIEIDKQKSGVTGTGVNEVINFENETEIVFSAITPNHIIRTKLMPPSNGDEQEGDEEDTEVEGLEIIQPTDTTVIVKATSTTPVQATVVLQLVDRHSEYVGVLPEPPYVTGIINPPITNLNGETVSQTFDPKPVKKGVKLWDEDAHCYRYIDSFNSEKIDEGEIDQQTGELVPKYPNDPNVFYEYKTKDATSFYEAVGNTVSINVNGVKLVDSIDLGDADLNPLDGEYIAEYQITDLHSTENNIGEITFGVKTTIDDEPVIDDDVNVTTDSIRLESWPMNLEFRPNDDKDKFLFDLNSAMPYTYKIKSIYNGIVKDYKINVLGNRLIISNKPQLVNKTTREKEYVVKVGEVSAVEFYSNPVVDRNYITYTATDGVELFDVGTVKLARFNEIGIQQITATVDDGKRSTQPSGENVKTVIVNVVSTEDYDNREDQDPQNDCTVTFNTNGGSKVNKQNKIIVDGGSLLNPSQIKSSKKGYTLDGWYKEAGLTNAWNFASDKVTQDIVLYAKWTAIPTPTPTPTLDPGSD